MAQGLSSRLGNEKDKAQENKSFQCSLRER